MEGRIEFKPTVPPTFFEGSLGSIDIFHMFFLSQRVSI